MKNNEKKLTPAEEKKIISAYYRDMRIRYASQRQLKLVENAKKMFGIEGAITEEEGKELVSRYFSAKMTGAWEKRRTTIIQKHFQNTKSQKPKGR